MRRSGEMQARHGPGARPRDGVVEVLPMMLVVVLLVVVVVAGLLMAVVVVAAVVVVVVVVATAGSTHGCAPPGAVRGGRGGCSRPSISACTSRGPRLRWSPKRPQGPGPSRGVGRMNHRDTREKQARTRPRGRGAGRRGWGPWRCEECTGGWPGALAAPCGGGRPVRRRGERRSRKAGTVWRG